MDYISVQAAVERAMVSMAVRALLARESAQNPLVDGVTLRVTHDTPGLVVVECELEAGGVHVEGFPL